MGAASGGVVNVLTKSGTSAYHGTAWSTTAFRRTRRIRFDTIRTAIPKGASTRNQFGMDSVDQS